MTLPIVPGPGSGGVYRSDGETRLLGVGSQLTGAGQQGRLTEPGGRQSEEYREEGRTLPGARGGDGDPGGGREGGGGGVGRERARGGQERRLAVPGSSSCRSGDGVARSEDWSRVGIARVVDWSAGEVVQQT